MRKANKPHHNINVDWDELSKRTSDLKPAVQAVLDEWLTWSNDWTGGVSFDDYPPRLLLKIKIHYMTRGLSDIDLEEAGKLATTIRDKFGLKVRLFKNYKKPELLYVFKLPIFVNLHDNILLDKNNQENSL